MENKKIKENYEEGIRDLIKPSLKGFEFKKASKFMFYKVKNDFYQEILFDRSSKTPNLFSVNLSVIILSLPICFNEKLEFPRIPAKRGVGMQYFGEWAELSENLELVKKQFKKTLDWIKNYGVEWLDNLSNYSKLKIIYEKERKRLLERYMIGRWADLIGAISYEKTGEIKKALFTYKNISKEDLENLGKGVQDFVKSKINELGKNGK